MHLCLKEYLWVGPTVSADKFLTPLSKFRVSPRRHGWNCASWINHESSSQKAYMIVKLTNTAKYWLVAVINNHLSSVKSSVSSLAQTFESIIHKKSHRSAIDTKLKINFKQICKKKSVSVFNYNTKVSISVQIFIVQLVSEYFCNVNKTSRLLTANTENNLV